MQCWKKYSDHLSKSKTYQNVEEENYSITVLHPKSYLSILQINNNDLEHIILQDHKYLMTS